MLVLHNVVLCSSHFVLIVRTAVSLVKSSIYQSVYTARAPRNDTEAPRWHHHDIIKHHAIIKKTSIDNPTLL